MENTDFDWLNGNWASNLEFSTLDSPRAGTAAEPASQAAERVDQTALDLYLFSSQMENVSKVSVSRIQTIQQKSFFDTSTATTNLLAFPRL
jgi:hypothetical protein